MQIIEGLDYWNKALTEKQTDCILSDLRIAVKQSPFFTPTMPKTGRAFSVKMTNMGKLGWVSDQKKGYRYQHYHPITHKKWPLISVSILEVWKKYTNLQIEPDCCLINYYDMKGKMGLHTDNDEKNFLYPVLSISIGASALFRFGGLKRSDKTQSMKLNHGDIMLFSGKSRLIYHGIDRIYPTSEFDYRINLTLRKI